MMDKMPTIRWLTLNILIGKAAYHFASQIIQQPCILNIMGFLILQARTIGLARAKLQKL